jgi:PAS domain-containing protein
MDSGTVITVTASAASAMFCGFLVWRSSGRATDVNERAAELSWVKEMRQDATDTRKELDLCKQQVQTLSRQLDVVTREAEHWIAQYQLVHRTAWRPGMTLERIKELLGPDLPQTSNGKS